MSKLSRSPASPPRHARRVVSEIVFVEGLEGRRLLSAAVGRTFMPPARGPMVPSKVSVSPPAPITVKAVPGPVLSAPVVPLPARRPPVARPPAKAGTLFRPPTDALPSVTTKAKPASPAASTASSPAASPAVSAAVRKSGLAHTNYVAMLPYGINRPTGVGLENPFGLTAAQVRQAYGLNDVSFNGITGDGAGQTIAIVAAYDHPGFVNSTDPTYADSDLAKFSAAMGLPDPPSFTKVDQRGGTNYPAPDASWAAEIALDVQWAHAMAPMANIVLVVADSAFNADLIGKGVNYARTLPGVTVVSMSFGIDGGLANQSYYDQFFTTPPGRPGITFVAATGDRGAVLPTNGTGGGTASGAYPAESPNVVAVGGTTLSRDASGNYAGETAWIGSGGGISNYSAKPIYQAGITQSSTKRTIPDVAMLADPATGVAVYDSYNNTSGGGWSNAAFGGTSLSAPLWAGLVAVANQGRALDGRAALNGVGQTLPRLYQVPTNTFHDVVTGHNRRDGVNGYNAGPGYDLVTGRGTPVAGLFAPALAGGLYTGTTYTDANSSGAFDGTEAVLGGVTVYNDANNNATLDAGETRAVSNAGGVFALDLAGGITYTLRAVAPGATPTTTAYTGTTAYGTFSGFSFGHFPTSITAPTGANVYTVRLNPAATSLQVFLNAATTGAPTYETTSTTIGTLVLNGNTADDMFVFDMTNGDPRVFADISFNGGGQASADRLRVIAATDGTDVAFGGGPTATIDDGTLAYSGVEVLTFTGGAGDDSLAISAGLNVSPRFTGGGGADRLSVLGGAFATDADLAADGSRMAVVAGGTARVTLNATQHLESLSLGGSAVVMLPGTGKLLRTEALEVGENATLDLAANAMIVDYAGASPVSSIGANLARGYAAGAWTGTGLRSSAAAADIDRRRTLGFGEAGGVLGLTGSNTGSFMGETVDATSLLVRYTIHGDATLNGRTDFTDFLLVQSNFGKTGRTFAEGDFTYDGVTNFNDFLLLQSNFGRTA